LGDADENSAKEVGSVLRWLTYIRNQYGCTIVVCHHYNKSSSNSGARGGQRVRGSSAFHGWVESALYVKVTQELYTVDVEREFRAFQKMPNYKVKIELGGSGDLYYNTTVEMTQQAGNIKAHSIEQSASIEIKENNLMDALSQPQTVSNLEELTGMSSSTLRRKLSELIKEGKVIKKEDGSRGSGNATLYARAEYEEE
jgi:DNA-binding transcriptional ArsR family regulator